MPGGDDANGEILEGKEAMPHDKSCPKNDNFGLWVLVARKKKFSSDIGKVNAQPSFFGYQGPSKSSPSQTISPTRPKFVYSVAEKSNGTCNHVTPSANHTNPFNGGDQSRLTQHHAPSKDHSRG